MRVVFCISVMGLTLGAALGKDLGTFGEVFPIQEESLLDHIQHKLQALAEKGTLKTQEEVIRSRIKASLEAPTPVEGVKPTKQPRTFYFDPSLLLTADITDHEGKVIHHKGTRVNPLHRQKLSKPLLFINGRCPKQVTWALEVKASQPLSKIILVAGKPFEIMKAHDLPVYFDQGGKLVRKLGIAQVPARVTQEGDRLRIEEVQPNG